MPEPIRQQPLRVTSYWDRTKWPLQSLYFLLPLLVAYQVGTIFFAPVYETRLPPILAESLLADFFRVFGMSGYYVPGLVLIVILVCQHFVSRDRQDSWKPEPRLYVLMLLESIVLAVPLFVFMMILFREMPQMAHSATAMFSSAGAHGGGMGLMAAALDAKSNGSGGVIPDWPAGIIFSLGAGIYEELLFRLVAIALLHMLFADILALPEKWCAVGAVVISALAFGLYHFASQQFAVGKFLFYTAAGIYFAIIYLLRGFGIAAATHAAYDVIWVIMVYSLY